MASQTSTILKSSNPEYFPKVTLEDFNVLAGYTLKLEYELERAKKENSVLREAINSYEKGFEELLK